MIYDRHTGFFMRAFNAVARSRAMRRARRWMAAYDRDPALAEDLIELGQVVTPGAVDMQTGRLEMSEADLAYERGRRDVCVELLAMMTTTHDFLRMLENNDET